MYLCRLLCTQFNCGKMPCDYLLVYVAYVYDYYCKHDVIL